MKRRFAPRMNGHRRRGQAFVELTPADEIGVVQRCRWCQTLSEHIHGRCGHCGMNAAGEPRRRAG